MDISEARAAAVNASNRLKTLLAPAALGGHHLRNDDRRTIEQQKLVDRLSDDAKRLAALADQRGEQWRLSGAALQAVESWLGMGRPSGTELIEIVTEPPKPARTKAFSI